ncbi:MAG: S-layer homology domain-containing protein, partial [Sporomusaceae bacterium]|nr:S-layer homology domain-containing protein [Sporomusaceae bacterium]
MKKKVSLALAVAMATSVGATAMAAPANPFSDVPSKHWSYNAVQQLAKAGIVDGFNDGTFKGDKTMTRYEMATIVARAMAKVDKADAQQKAMIDKLAAEYSTELQNLGVRVTNLENKVGNIKWEGYARLRSESYSSQNGENGTSRTRERVRLFMTAPIDQDWTFKGRVQYESFENSNAGQDSSNMTLANAYVTGKALGLDQISVGRVPLFLGQGIIADLSGNYKQSAPSTVSIGKKIGAFNLGGGFGRYEAVLGQGTLNLAWANMQVAATDNLTFDATYLKDRSNSVYPVAKYKTTAVGLKYTGFENFTLSGEYGKNAADGAKVKGQSPKAYEVTLK